MKVYFDYLSPLNENKKKPTKQVVKESKKLNESATERTVGIYGDEVRGFNDVQSIATFFKQKGLKVSNVSGNFERGWEMDLTGEPRKLFFAVCENIPGYNSTSIDEFIDEYAVDDLDESKKRMNESTELTTLNDFLDELEKACRTKTQADRLYIKAKETLGKGDFGLFEKEYVQMRNGLSESNKRMNEDYSPEYELFVSINNAVQKCLDAGVSIDAVRKHTKDTLESAISTWKTSHSK